METRKFEEEIKGTEKWKIIYPQYIDSNLTVSQGK